MWPTSTRRSNGPRRSPAPSGARSRSGRSSRYAWHSPLAEGGAFEAVDRVFRAESGRVVAGLIRSVGDFDLAEESVQEAFVEALEHWPLEGVPANPGAWIALTARRKAIDRVRRAKVL